MPLDLVGKSFALLCALLWAFAVIYFKRAGETIRPAALNLYKTTITIVLLAPVLWIADGMSWPSAITDRDLLLAVASGVAGIAIADSLFFRCLNILGAGLTAIVECFYSPMVILLAFLALGQGLDARQAGGALLIISAVLLATLKAKETDLPPARILLGILVGAGAMFFMATGIILMKPVLHKASIFWVMEVRMLAALPVLLLIVALDPRRKAMLASLRNVENLKHALPGTFLGNFLGMLIWVAAFKLTSVNSAAILNQTNTIFVLILATLLLKEPFTPRRVAATVMATAGSVLVLI
ncbi:DMT family transporter [Elusimicrobiota bacterium]